MRCDSHVHVVAPMSQCPQIPGRTFLAEPAPLDRLVENGRPFGIDHFVITQPSFYGTDNSVLLEALDALSGRGSGVATAAPGATDDELRAWRKRGVSGLRVNLYSPGRPECRAGNRRSSIGGAACRPPRIPRRDHRAAARDRGTCPGKSRR